MFLIKNKNGFYHIIYQKPNGRRGTKTTKEKLKTKAIKKLREFQRQLEIERTQAVIPIRMQQFFFNYLRSQEPHYTNKTMETSKSSFRIILKHFGDIPLTDLTTQQIESFLLKRVNETSVYAPRKDFSVLSCALNRAVRDGYLLKNPCKGIKRFKLPEKTPLFYSQEEFKKLMNVIDDLDLHDLVTVAVNTGMRQTELITLEWDQVNFNERIITLNNRNHITKGKKILAMPMNSCVNEVLDKRYLNKNGMHNFVFTLRGKPLEQFHLSKYFKKHVHKAEINPKLHFHSLRHAFASWLVQKGVSLYVVSRLLNHSDIKTTQIYAHLQKENLANAVKVLDQAV